MSEASSLAGWLAGNAAAVGLLESAVPDDDSERSRRRGVTVTDRTKLGMALECAASGRSAGCQGTMDRWVAELGRRLALDAVEARILAPALHYRLDRRIEGLCVRIGNCGRRQCRSRSITASMVTSPLVICCMLAVPLTSIRANKHCRSGPVAAASAMPTLPTGGGRPRSCALRGAREAAAFLLLIAGIQHAGVSRRNRFAG